MGEAKRVSEHEESKRPRSRKMGTAGFVRSLTSSLYFCVFLEALDWTSVGPGGMDRESARALFCAPAGARDSPAPPLRPRARLAVIARPCSAGREHVSF
jgi:hypothetical protein